MNEQRRQILQMLAEEKITADQAERLIDALGPDQPGPPPGGGPRTNPRPKYLRVIVEDRSGDDRPSRVNIRIPLLLLRAGVRLTTLLPPQALTRVNAELTKAGIPIDLSELKPQQFEELIEQLHDVTVDVNEPDAKVQVFCE